MALGPAIVLTSFAALIAAQAIRLAITTIRPSTLVRTDDLARGSINIVFVVAAFIGAMIWIWSGQ